MKNHYSFIFLMMLLIGNSNAQSDQPAQTHFMIRGYGHTGFQFLQNGNNEITFSASKFSPIFLVRHSKKLLFEAELEFELEDNEVHTEFEYADLNYVLNKYLTVRAGKFLLPFGIFADRLHPSWINNQRTNPLGYGHDGIAPMTDVGAEVRGAFYIGGSKLNYSLYCTNGPSLNTGEHEPDEAGRLGFENSFDNNNDKAIGGRIGFLPFSNSSVEIGLSAYSGKTGNEQDDAYKNVRANLYAADFTFVRQIEQLKGMIDIKAQYNFSDVDKAAYYELVPGDSVAQPFSFTNQSSAYFVQLSYRPFFIANRILSNVELTGRYSQLATPESSKWAENSIQWSAGVNYWITWRNVVKISYESIERDIENNGKVKPLRAFYIQWALGF